MTINSTNRTIGSDSLSFEQMRITKQSFSEAELRKKYIGLLLRRAGETNKYIIATETDREHFCLCGTDQNGFGFVLSNASWRKRRILDLLGLLTTEETIVIFDTPKEAYRWMSK